MKLNSTADFHLTLAAYFDTGVYKHVCFLAVMLLYAFIVCANVFLVVLVCVNTSLHEPMFLFLCSLFVNDLYGSSGLFPFLLLQLLSDVHTVSAPLCCVQIFCLYSYGSVEFSSLAVMSYDRYVAVCRPLQYHSRMTSRKVTMLMVVTWLPPFFIIFIVTCLTASLNLCGNVINKVYCDNFYVVSLSCSDTTSVNSFELAAASVVMGVPLFVILYTYVSIFKVCFSGSRQTRQRAVSTCAPHLASLLNFFVGTFFQILQSRLDVSVLPNLLQILLSLYVLMCPPILNPLIYGLQMSKICILCRSLFSGLVGKSSNKTVQTTV